MPGSDVRRRLEQAKSKKTIRLVIKGRRTGLLRPVRVLFLYLDDRLFVRTSHRTQWSKNLRKNQKITVELGDLHFSARTEKVIDESLLKRLKSEYRRRYHIFDIFLKLVMLRGDIILFEIKYEQRG